MCGIIGYTGKEKVLPILIKGLHSLEYRGYDSAGVAVGNANVNVIKSKGRISVLEEKINASHSDIFCETRGIAHTRWATHGVPSDKNSHPHTAPSLVLVHNGIIENHSKIEEQLLTAGYTFESDTDTEVAAKLTDLEYRKTKDPEKAVFAATKKLKGSYAFGIIFKDIPEKIYAIRKGSPLIAAKTETGTLIASDVTAVVGLTDEYSRPEENVLIVLSPNRIEYKNEDGSSATPKKEKIDFDISMAKKGGYPHFMLKEIKETPESVGKILSAYAGSGIPRFGCDILDGDSAKNIKRIHIAACGTAMHAGLVGKRLIEKFARIPVNVEIASEFRYRNPIVEKDDLVILLSQSGETADTLAALRHAKEKGIKTLAVVNVYGSSIAVEADSVLYTKAGPEIAVASTKAYAVQCTLLALLALRLANIFGRMTTEEVEKQIEIMKRLPKQLERVFESEDKIAVEADKIKDKEHIFYIGRGIDSDAVTEGSLKLKEISYIHSESYPAGELKHGTISLIEEGVPVIALMTDFSLSEKTVSAIREVKSRGARVTVFVTEEIEKNVSFPRDETVTLPSGCADYDFLPAVTSLQLLAYHVSTKKGYDVDKPRNLAKSVTVE